MRFPYSLFRRPGSSGTRPIYYVQFWDSDTGRYRPGKSTSVLVEALGLDPSHYSPRTKAGARMIAECWLKAQASPGAARDATLRLGPYLESFWTWETSEYIAGKLSRRPGSIGRAHVANSLSWVKRYVPRELGTLPIDKVTTGVLEEWLMGLRKTQLTNRTINRVLQAVRLPLREAHRLGKIGIDPGVSVLPLGEVDVEKGILTDQEVANLLALEWKDQLAYVAFCVALCGGLRLGEVQALRGESIRHDHVVVAHSYSKVVGLKSTKTSKERIVTLPPRVLEMLRSTLAANPHGESWVFWRSNKTGVPISERAIENGFYWALEAIGIPSASSEPAGSETRQGRRLSFHSLRHWFTATLHGSLPGEKLRLLTGHQSEKMTRRYDHVTDQDKRTLLEAQQSRIEVLFPDDSNGAPKRS